MPARSYFSEPMSKKLKLKFLWPYLTNRRRRPKVVLMLANIKTSLSKRVVLDEQHEYRVIWHRVRDDGGGQITRESFFSLIMRHLENM